jgi:hypothetical protein
MTGPFGSPDDVAALKLQFVTLIGALVALFSAAPNLARFERLKFPTFKVPSQTESPEYLDFFLAKAIWTLALVWLALAWFLPTRVVGLTFGYYLAYYAILFGAVFAGVLWPLFFFAERPRRWIAYGFLALSALAAVAALVVHTVDVYLNWATLVGAFSAVVASIAAGIYAGLCFLALIYFYNIGGGGGGLKGD